VLKRAQFFFFIFLAKFLKKPEFYAEFQSIEKFPESYNPCIANYLSKHPIHMFEESWLVRKVFYLQYGILFDFGWQIVLAVLQGLLAMGSQQGRPVILGLAQLRRRANGKVYSTSLHRPSQVIGYV
jgi:hypothetical protein